MFYLAGFRSRIWRIPGFYENKTQYWALFSTKPTKVGFIFIEPNSLSRAEDLAAVSHVTQEQADLLGRRLGLKVGFKELWFEPKFLNRGLWTGKRINIILAKRVIDRTCNHLMRQICTAVGGVGGVGGGLAIVKTYT